MNKIIFSTYVLVKFIIDAQKIICVKKNYNIAEKNYFIFFFFLFTVFSYYFSYSCTINKKNEIRIRNSTNDK